MSMAVICYARDIIEYDRITPELSNTPLHIAQDTISIEKKTLKPSSSTSTCLLVWVVLHVQVHVFGRWDWDYWRSVPQGQVQVQRRLSCRSVNSCSAGGGDLELELEEGEI